jgi:hypothetical protein
MGMNKKRRAFNDFNLFVAQTTHERVAGLAIPDPITGEVLRCVY